jgi:hypothetical protein
VHHEIPITSMSSEYKEKAQDKRQDQSQPGKMQDEIHGLAGG